MSKTDKLATAIQMLALAGSALAASIDALQAFVGDQPAEISTPTTTKPATTKPATTKPATTKKTTPPPAAAEEDFDDGLGDPPSDGEEPEEDGLGSEGEEAEAEEGNEPEHTIDETRGLLREYSGIEGRDAAIALLKKHGGTTKIADVASDKIDGLYAAIVAATKKAKAKAKAK